MAIVTTVSIGTGNKVSVDYQSQEVSVNVTYELERDDADLLAFVTEKAAEVEEAHSAIWRKIREARSAGKANAPNGNRDNHDMDDSPLSSIRRERAGRRRETPVVESAVDSDEGSALDTEERAPAEDGSPCSAAQQRAILSLANLARLSDASLTEALSARYGKTAVEQLTKNEAARFLMDLQRRDREEFLAAEAG